MGITGAVAVPDLQKPNRIAATASELMQGLGAMEGKWKLNLSG